MMSSFTNTHLVAKEILDTPLVVETEIDAMGDVDVTMYINKDSQHKVTLSLDYPNWVTLRESVDQHFQDFDMSKKGEAKA